MALASPGVGNMMKCWCENACSFTFIIIYLKNNIHTNFMFNVWQKVAKEVWVYVTEFINVLYWSDLA